MYGTDKLIRRHLVLYLVGGRLDELKRALTRAAAFDSQAEW